MAIDQDAMVDPRLLAKLVTQYEVEQFYYAEAALLDAHRYRDWYDLFTDDTHYFMPIRRTRTRRELDKEFTKPGEMAYFDDDKMLLNGRVLKFESGTSWAEDPPSRTRHMVHNVRVAREPGRGARHHVQLPHLPHPVEVGRRRVGRQPSGHAAPRRRHVQDREARDLARADGAARPQPQHVLLNPQHPASVHARGTLSRSSVNTASAVIARRSTPSSVSCSCRRLREVFDHLDVRQ